jgi:hypothetical protein
MNSLNQRHDNNPNADVLQNSSIAIERPVVNKTLISHLQKKVGDVSYHQILRSIAGDPIDVGERPFISTITKELVSRIPELAQELREIQKSQQMWQRACGLFIGNPKIDEFFKNHAALGLAVQEMLSEHLLLDTRRVAVVYSSAPGLAYPILLRSVCVSELGLQALEAPCAPGIR